MTELDLTSELTEIQNSIWGATVRENIALALEKLENLPKRSGLSLWTGYLDTLALWQPNLKKTIKGMQNRAQTLETQLETIQSKLEKASGKGILQCGRCGEEVYYVILDTGEITLYGTGATYDYTSDAVSPFYQNEAGKTITISEGITQLGDFLFASSGITEVTIPSSVAAWGSYVFRDCLQLTAARVESYQTGTGAFYNCTALTSLIISENCTELGAFLLDGCYRLSEMTYEGTVAKWGAISKGTSWDVTGGTAMEPKRPSRIVCSDGTLKFNTETEAWEEETA